MSMKQEKKKCAYTMEECLVLTPIVRAAFVDELQKWAEESKPSSLPGPKNFRALLPNSNIVRTNPTVGGEQSRAMVGTHWFSQPSGKRKALLESTDALFKGRGDFSAGTTIDEKPINYRDTVFPHGYIPAEREVRQRREEAKDFVEARQAPKKALTPAEQHALAAKWGDKVTGLKPAPLPAQTTLPAVIPPQVTLPAVASQPTKALEARPISATPPIIDMYQRALKQPGLGGVERLLSSASGQDLELLSKHLAPPKPATPAVQPTQSRLNGVLSRFRGILPTFKN